MKSLQVLKKDYKKMVAQRDAAREEIERLKTQLSDADERFGDYAYHKGYMSPEDANRLREQLQRAKDEVTAATGYVAKLEATIKQHEANIRFLNEQSGGALTTIDALRAQVALLTSEVETWKRVAEANLAMAEKAANAAGEAKAAFDKLSEDMKAEDLKSLRKRLHSKTERINELERTVAESNRLINAFLRIPAVAEEIARKEEERKTRLNPDNANGAANQPSFPAPVQP